jgi:hypothetical protein
MNKLSRNDKCHCGSTKKYKICCMIHDEDTAQHSRQLEKIAKLEEQRATNQSSNAGRCINELSNYFPKHSFINITEDITANNYRAIQTRYYKTQIILIAEKTNTNASVFVGRVDNPRNDIIVMYNGAYRTFPFDNLSLVLNSVCDMIRRYTT